MKLTLRNLALRIFGTVLALGAGAAFTACDETETTDSTEFAIYYSGVTDIGPSQHYLLPAPTYIGPAPSDFSITGVKLEGNAITTESFRIEPETGEIHVENTADLAVGHYTISVGCTAGGNRYNFADAVSVNMMKPVPDGIKVEPAVMTVDYGDIIDIYSLTDLPTAQVTTEGEHISITRYAFSNIRHNGEAVSKCDFIEVSKDGEITFKRGSETIKPGRYTFDMRLMTAIVDGSDPEEGLFANAFEVVVTSRPLALAYTPSEVKAEENQAFTTAAPVLTGSTDGVRYALKSVEPATDAITIDESTGAVTIAADNGFAIGTKFNISVTATNEFGTKDFDNVLSMEIVGYIAPVTELEYEVPADVVRGGKFEIAVSKIVGGEVTYEFGELSAIQAANLSIDQFTGLVSAPQGNTLPEGENRFTVIAKNYKSEKSFEIVLNIASNPNFFTFFDYGNNIGLTPTTDYASQYRVSSAAELAALTLEVQNSDINPEANVEWTIANNFSSCASIDKATGKLTFTEAGFVAGRVQYMVVRATAGKGTAGETVVKIPLFIHCNAAVNGVTVEYTPFALTVNPRRGLISEAPKVTGMDDMSMFIMDYRRNFNYLNINGPEEHKMEKALGKDYKDNFLGRLWSQYYSVVGKAVNYGSKDPISGLTDLNFMSAKLAYVSKARNWAVTVPANFWVDDYGYANGIFHAQMTFVTDGKEANVSGSKNQIFPVAIWFDTKF